jgi:hypothetical protein
MLVNADDCAAALRNGFNLCAQKPQGNTTTAEQHNQPIPIINILAQPTNQSSTMVKVQRKVMREAAFEAEKRTVSLSMKSVVGQPLIDVSRSGEAKGGVFNSERFIFGEIRPYLLRSANRPHWVEMTVKSAAESSGIGTVQHSAGFRTDEYESVHSRVDLEVLRRLVALDIVLHGFVSSVLGAAREADGLEEHRNGPFSAHSTKAGLRFDVLSWLETLSSATAHSEGKQSSGFDQRARVVDDIGSRINVCGSCTSLLNEDSFGTAPIWYQQSMATGPPVGKCSLWG